MGSDDRLSTDMEPSRPRGRDEVVEAVLEAARTLISEQGPSAVSTRTIAQAANVNKGLVHMYVGNRAELVAEVYRRAAAATDARLEQLDDLEGVVQVLLSEPSDADVRLLAWAALGGSNASTIFSEPVALKELTKLMRRSAGADGRVFSDDELRIAGAVASTIVTAWRVLSTGVLSSTGVETDNRSRLDEIFRGIVRSVVSLEWSQETEPGEEMDGPS